MYREVIVNPWRKQKCIIREKSADIASEVCRGMSSHKESTPEKTTSAVCQSAFGLMPKAASFFDDHRFNDYLKNDSEIASWEFPLNRLSQESERS